MDECLELPEVKALIKLYGDSNIIRLRNVVYQSKMKKKKKTLHRLMHDKINLCTDPELLHGLFENRIGLFSESEIKGWSRQILLALTLMHQPGGYMHRDLKPDNLLVTKGGELIKIADFGQARQIDSKLPYSVSYTSAVDMWAVGAIMAELYSFRPLFPGLDRADQLYKICSVIGSPTYESWVEGIQLANSCGYKFPRVHPYGLSTMIPSASLEAIDLIKSLCSWDPKMRPTAMEALQHPYFAPICVHYQKRQQVQSWSREYILIRFALNITSENLLKSYEFGAALTRLFPRDSSSNEADSSSAMTKQVLCAF
ncbi:hypothetical protein MKW98_020503 [Papaver atlanticum]|uniref:Protein kinase domain-containing protein n=1 Tax=Papaver atlanticum TaxID=357466 RepID=A0AAD4SS71_9MAGN|nr:hypothetical protein MKW98_020503 [Papaver atlanticum]